MPDGHKQCDGADIVCQSDGCDDAEELCDDEYRTFDGL